ncbi:MAG: NUDIX domain-containing protein [Patescibacteria group bacterium]
MPDDRVLNIIDEAGKIIGEETREKIHRLGLLHREVHVWFYTSKAEIIFQHRAKDKDTFPDLLDASVAGHVEIGDSPLETALKEIEEEAGIKVKEKDLIFIGTIRNNSYDPATGTTNNAAKLVYAYKYDDGLNNLKVEKGKGIGFEAWPLEKIFTLLPEDKKRFIPTILGKDILSVFREIQKLIK